MAPKLRLPNRTQLVDICPGGNNGFSNFLTYGELAKLAGSHKKSSGGVEIRINIDPEVRN